MTERAVPWRVATERALYGPAGFFRRTAGPAAHFRTSVHESVAFAEALLTLTRAAGLTAVVDVGGGRGELARALHSLDPDLTLTVVELADRPRDLPEQIGWTHTIPPGTEALLVANEWLDNVPVDIAQQAGDGPRQVLVDPATGQERLGEQLTGRDRAWLDTWWPIQSPGDRAEIGWPRDAAWAEAVSSLRRGIAVAADYEHRSAARPAGGSLAGYRDGHRVPPVPDGSCDITSHVALDACADAGRRAGARWTVHTTQRETLRALGIARPSPPYDVARSDPARYLAELSRGSQVAELTRAGGLGDFGWLVQGVALDPPDVLSSLLGDTPGDPGLGNS